MEVTNRIKHDDNQYKSLFYTSLAQVQSFIDELKEKGNLVIIAHPKNPLIPLDFLLELQRYDGIEVFNGKSNQDATDYSLELFNINKTMRFTAVDDSHAYRNSQDEVEFFRGFIVVEDGCQDRDAIFKAIKGKRFYASTGPKINRIEISEAQLVMDCDTNLMVEFFVYLQDELSPRHVKDGPPDGTQIEVTFEKPISHFLLVGTDHKGGKVWFSFGS